jgi:hypothetical protein
MTDNLESGPEFSVDCAPIITTVLTCVLARAVKDAATSESDTALSADRLETLRQELLREAKSAFSEGVPYGIEAKGVAEALTIINWVCDCVRDQAS